jgi:glucose/arabinose dehydrogenase
VLLSWEHSSDDVAVSAYDLFHDGQLVQSVPGTTSSATVAVVPGVPWGWYVNARDAAGNVSQASETLAVVPPRCAEDTTAPTAPTAVTARATGTSVVVEWQASSDDVGVSRYDVVRDGVRAGQVPVRGAGEGLSFTDSGLAPAQTYVYTVVAVDAQGNASPPSDPARATTSPTCTSPLCGVSVVAEDDDVPWGLTALPDGEVLYSRRDAHDVVALDPVTGARRSIGRVPGVVGTDGEGGLMGLAVAPTFASDRWLYAMHSTATDNRVIRIRYAHGSLDASSTQVLVSGILRNKYHNGGRLRFGPDGLLYAATGDAQNGAYSQALTGVGALNGKILRMTPTGDVPADNPFGTLVWSYGHRNPQGLAFDGQGRLWSQEFGNSEQDETNLVQRGGNHGWPQCEGTVSQSGSGCAAPGLVAPKATYAPAAGSCSGIAVVRDTLWVACARGARLYRHTIDGGSLTGTQQLLVGSYGRLRTVEPAADGGLWLTTTNDGDKDSIPNNSAERILRLRLGAP